MKTLSGPITVLCLGDWCTRGKERRYVDARGGTWEKPSVILAKVTSNGVDKIEVPLTDFPSRWVKSEANLTCNPKVVGAYNA